MSLQFTQYFGGETTKPEPTKKKKKKATTTKPPVERDDEVEEAEPKEVVPAEVTKLLKAWDTIWRVAKSLERMGISQPLTVAAMCRAVPQVAAEIRGALPILAQVCDQVVALVEEGDGHAVVFPPLPGHQRSGGSEKVRRSMLKTALLKANNSGETITTTDAAMTTAPTKISKRRRRSSSDDQEPNFVVQLLKDEAFYEDQIAHIERLAVRGPTFGQLPPGMLSYDLSRLASWPLYEHQARAAEAALRGSSVALCTGTASGKSLAYTIPTVDIATRNPRRCVALYLYPTKALAQDQLQQMRKKFEQGGLHWMTVATLDGDVGWSERRDIEESPPAILLTNPDMLHYTILTNPKYRRNLLASVRMVVVDEAHVYVGAFGAHVACVLRRLRRLVDDLVFFCASATIANPLEHTRALLGIEDVVVISNDTSPRNDKAVVIWNPPLREDGSMMMSDDQVHAELRRGPVVPLAPPQKKKKTTITGPSWRHRTIDLTGEPGSSSSSSESDNGMTAEERTRLEKAEVTRRELHASFLANCFDPNDDGLEEAQVEFGKRKSPIFETAQIFAALAKKKVRCICFARTRKLVELILGYAMDILKKDETKHKIAAYRGGYDKSERRKIEQGLFGGSLIGVVATCALELGVDIGHLDATVHLGHPGSIASLWQQAGRAGRRPGSTSAAIVVCWDAPIDQQFARCGSRLLNRTVEAAALDIRGNDAVLRGHLLCAAAEVPLNPQDDLDTFLPRRDDDEGDRSSVFTETIEHLVHRGKLEELSDGTFGAHASHKKTAAKAIDLRLIDPESFDVMDVGTMRKLDEVPYSRAFYELYEGAIYLHQAKPYLITKLDLVKFTATATALGQCSYRTSARNHTDVDPTKCLETKNEISTGYVHVRSEVWGYRKVCRRTGKILSCHTFSLPPLEFDTRGTWIDVPVEAITKIQALRRDLPSAIHAANHALLNVAPLFVLGCDTSDVQTEHTHEAQQRPRPNRIMIYDARPGGIGVADTLFRRIDTVLAQALELLTSCPCKATTGCPSCLFSCSCSAHNLVLDKVGAAVILNTVLEKRRVCSTCTAASMTTPPQSPSRDHPPQEETPRRKSRRESLRRAACMDAGPTRAKTIYTGWAPIIPELRTGDL